MANTHHRFDFSNLSQADFCSQHGLNAKYFSWKRSKLLNARNSAGDSFVRAKVERPASMGSWIELAAGRAAIKLSLGAPADYVAQLAGALV